MDNLGKDLDRLGKTSSLYIHVPFCAYRCRYCDFYFETTRSVSLQKRFADKLLQDARSLKLRGALSNLETLYFGGGTPSVLEPGILEDLLGGLEEILGKPALEGTFELNPEGVTPRMLEVLAQGGITRLSLGIQSLEEEVLRTLGRRAWKEVTLGALEVLKSHWKGTWSMDIMTGLPGQDKVSLGKDLESLLAWNPPHVSLYSLTLEENTPLDQLAGLKKIRLPKRLQSDQLWLQAARELESRGMEWYEISNFAHSGAKSLHNQVYWRLDPYAGLGPGAHGTLVRGIDGKAIRTKMPGLFPWLSGTAAEIEVLEPGEFFLEHLITALRTSRGLRWESLVNRFGLDLRTAWGRQWGQLAEKGYLDLQSLTGPFLVLTRPGRLHLDGILEDMALWAESLELKTGSYPREFFG